MSSPRFVPNAMTQSEAMQLQSLGKLTRQMSRMSSTRTAPDVIFLLSATRSITRPHASDHITLVWLSAPP